MTQKQNTCRTLEASLRAVGRQERALFAQEHFEIFISPSPAYHLSFAVPTLPNPRDWQPHIQGLKQIFSDQERQPRLEFLAELHPQLATALTSAGFVQEMSAPVLTLTAEEWSNTLPTMPTGYRRFTADDEALLRPFLMGQAVAYGGTADESALAWLPTMLAGIRSGTVMAAGLERDDMFVAGASVQIGDGIGELAGVWTAPDQRKQGLAFATCSQLIDDYRQAGYTLCWLSAAEGALRLYEKLGFEQVGTQLNFGMSQLTKNRSCVSFKPAIRSALALMTTPSIFSI